MAGASDPVRARRRQMARLAAAGRATGFVLFGLSLVVVAVGVLTGLNRTVVAVATACLVAGSVLLAPAIVVGYGVRAAEREDASPLSEEPRSGDRPTRARPRRAR